MRKSLTIYTVFSLLIIVGLASCGGGTSENNNNDSVKATDSTSLVKEAKTDSTKVDTTSEAFKASELVMFSPYTQHIPHFDDAETFKPSDELKQDVGKHTETCKDDSKQVWKKNKQGFMKCDCGGVENYVIFDPKGKWLYTRHLAAERKLADFQPEMDKDGIKFDSVGQNQIFKVVIARGYWYEVVNDKSGNTWWFDRNLDLNKFLD
ncbi:hypothetical protein BKI52_35825 [marine bacterium AO1-C]|nr:hypothetical protein BKI52_35825 [marine bacterium AO1-C]